MSELIQKTENGVCYLTLNRPEKMNSLNGPLARDFIQALQNAGSDKAVRAICVSGNGKAFCAGQDLAEVLDPQGPPLNTIVHEHYNPLIEAIRTVPKPVLAAVNGVAAGAGANIALACDIVIARKSAAFIQAFSKIGLIPDSAGTYFLPRLIGFQKASALMMLGDKVSAEEAERLGMIYKWVEDDAFEAEIEKTATHLAQMPTAALAATKEALNRSMVNTLSEQLEVEEELQSRCGTSADFKEGINAFLGKRAPLFKGE